MANIDTTLSEEDALVIWINTFSIPRPILTLRDLNDGNALWGMLGEIDDVFTGNLPSHTATENARLHNLQHIYRHIESYLDEGGRKYNSLSEEDLVNLSSGKPNPSFVKLLELVIGVMLISSKLPEFIPSIGSLSLPVRRVLMAIMQDIDNVNNGDLTENGDGLDYPNHGPDRKLAMIGSPVSAESKGDQLLELEEQYAHVMAQLKRRENDYADLAERFAQVQGTNEELKAQIAENDKGLKEQSSLTCEREQLSLKDLEYKISEQEETITNQESELEKFQSKVTSLQRENEKASDSNKTLQKLDDDLKITKVELDKQTKKANTADNYLRKLQLNQSIEKERDNLRLEVEEARKKGEVNDDLRQENSALQISNSEKSQTISQIERELMEHQRTKKQLRINYDSLAQEVHGLNERFAQDQETIADLRDKHGDSEIRLSPSLVNGGLESELADTSKYEDQMKTRVNELEKQNQILTSEALSSNTQVIVLQKQLESAQESIASHSSQTQQIRQENLAMETSFAQVRQGHPIEGFVKSSPHRVQEDPAHFSQSTEIFQRMRNQVKAKESRCLNLEEQLSQVRKDLEETRTDCMLSAVNHQVLTSLSIDLFEGSLVDKSKFEIDEQEKQQLSTSLTRLQSDHQILQERHRKLQAEIDQHTACRSGNIHVQDQCNKLDGIDKISIERLTQMIQEASSSREIGSLDSMTSLFVSKIEDGREKLAKQQKQIEEQTSILKSLQNQMQSQQFPQLPASTRMVDEKTYAQNLERENRLMASAFHNLAGRLQMNNVVLQRRAEAPKSWLGKQRKATEGPIGLAR